MKWGSGGRRIGHLSVSNSLFFYFGICISFPLGTNKLISYQDEYHISVTTIIGTHRSEIYIRLVFVK